MMTPPPVEDTLGRPLRDLRISVIDTCNFRCPYCMPEGEYPDSYPFLRPSERLSFDEVETLASLLMELGVVKVRLTGGEPLLRRDLTDLVVRLAALPGLEDLALTTNGLLLDRHAEALKAAGLHRLTISLDSLNEQTFAQLTGGRGSLERVLAGVAAAERAGFDQLKFNAVVQRGVNDDDVLDLVARFRGSGHTVRFIEYMDVGTCNRWDWRRVVPSAELRDRIHARWPLSSVDPEYRGEVARRYRFDDGAGEVGFISSVSAPFCGDCTRARLSADGRLYTCLFAALGTDLKGPLRAGETKAQLRQRMLRVWTRRGDRYSELRDAGNQAPRQRIEMYQIGG